jgi:hypothetical protein
MMRKPEGRRGASSAKEASIGAKISSAQVPTAFSSIPLHSYKPEKTSKLRETRNKNSIIRKDRPKQKSLFTCTRMNPNFLHQFNQV